MRLFISTGEPSGDLHAANLVQSLRRRFPDAEFVGFGGPRMEAEGVRLLYPLIELAIMWFGRAILNLHKFLAIASLADRHFASARPDAVILIDYPGFHWWIAWRAKVRGIPVFYYVPPQIWAWGGWRVKKVRKYVDHVLCSLPFEPAWYHARGVPAAVYIGHPYFDELAERELEERFLAEQQRLERPIVAILPGSRTQEVNRNFPMMLRAAARVALVRPDVRFAVACLRPKHAVMVREIIQQMRIQVPGLEVFVGRTPELIRLARCAWAVSGSVSLELMCEALPTVIVYKLNRLDLLIARPFIKSRYITLVNLLADAELMPEFLTVHDVSREMATIMLRWLNEPDAHAHTSQALAALRDRVAQPGASDRAADHIHAALTGREAPAGAPAPLGPLLHGPHIPDPVRETISLLDDEIDASI